MNEKLKERLRLYGRESQAFLGSRIFLKNFGGILGLLLLLMLLTSWWMRCYTHHGESLQVQDYLGMTFDDARQKAKKRSFKLVVSDSLFIVGKPPHQILEQDPAPMSRVKEDRKIYVTVTKKNPDLVLLPDLIGGNDDYNQYRRILGLVSVEARVRDRSFSNKLEPNTILDVFYNDEKITDKLSDGYKVPMGSVLDFIVTERSGGTVQIPQLVCKSYDEANFLIGNYSLNVGSVIPDGTVTDESTAYVWRQVPDYLAGATLRIGGQIDIYLTQYLPDDCNSNDDTPSDEEDESFGGNL